MWLPTAKTVLQSEAWFEILKNEKMKKVWDGRSVGSLKLIKFSFSAKTHSRFALAHNDLWEQSANEAITYNGWVKVKRSNSPFQTYD